MEKSTLNGGFDSDGLKEVSCELKAPICSIILPFQAFTTKRQFNYYINECLNLIIENKTILWIRVFGKNFYL